MWYLKVDLEGRRNTKNWLHAHVALISQVWQRQKQLISRVEWFHAFSCLSTINKNIFTSRYLIYGILIERKNRHQQQLHTIPTCNVWPPSKTWSHHQFSTNYNSILLLTKIVQAVQKRRQTSKKGYSKGFPQKKKH